VAPIGVAGRSRLTTVGSAAYADPARRIREWTSENSGDIIVLANMIKDDGSRYYFDEQTKQSQRGSLSHADSVVPLAFSYPGATSRDDTVDRVLFEVRRYLETVPAKDGWALSPIEREAMERALALPEEEPQP